MKATFVDAGALLVVGAAGLAFAVGSSFRGWSMVISIVCGCALLAGVNVLILRARGREVR